MARPKLKIDKEAWLQAIRDNCGMVTFVAKQLGIHRETVAKYRDEVDWIKDAFEAVEEETSDAAEKCLKDAVKTDWKAAVNYLDRKAQHRGYGKQVKVDATMQQKAVYHIYMPDDGREVKSDG
jgi:hypothetical protein